MMERIAEMTAGVLSVNPNTMYPLLRQLESRGLIEGKWEHPERRTRRYYSITREGKREYKRLVEEVRPFLDSVQSSIGAIVREVYGK
jgi:PadR family transcriptional regulator PadR